jgi:hypothetical protein
MIAYTLRLWGPVVSLILMMIVWMTFPGDAQGGTLYKYIDKDGSLILTDNPPPGVEAKEFESSEEVTHEKKVEPAKDASAQKQADQEAGTKRQEIQVKIQTLREELDQAVSEEAAHRRNMNQAHGYVQRNYWRKLVDEKLKEIEEKKKQIEELESSR